MLVYYPHAPIGLFCVQAATQAEFDEACALGHCVHVSRGLHYASNGGKIHASGTARVNVTRPVTIIATDRAAIDSATAASTIYASGGASVTIGADGYVYASGRAHIRAFDRSRIVATDVCHVDAYDHAAVLARDQARVVARGSAHIHARDSTRAVALGSASVNAHNRAHVTALDTTYVIAYDFADIDASASSVVLIASRLAKIHAVPSVSVTYTVNALLPKTDINNND